MRLPYPLLNSKPATRHRDQCGQSGGGFTLTYPEFDPVHKAIEVKAAGSQATIKYQDGAECVVSAAKDVISVSFKWRIARGRKCWLR